MHELSGTGAIFPTAARDLLQNSQTRKNVQHATNVIQAKRNKVVAELPDWEDLREAGAQVRAHALRHLDHYLTQFEENCTRAGGRVHWASDAAEANRIILGSGAATSGAREVIKIKTMTSEEVGLNAHLEAHGIQPIETDLAELIIQMGKDRPSHFVAPALHVNRQQVRADVPARDESARSWRQAGRPGHCCGAHLSAREVPARQGSYFGGNFLIADTGGICIVRSPKATAACASRLPDVLISIVGIEKVIPSFRDLEIFLQTLPRSATGERMNPI
jgi:L-lactate dehydrogenase complex protein LldF